MILIGLMMYDVDLLLLLLFFIVCFCFVQQHSSNINSGKFFKGVSSVHALYQSEVKMIL